MNYNIISYLIGDGIKNIAKNKKSTFSALIIMIVTMMTVGICFIIGENVKSILNEMESGYEIEVYIKDNIAETEKNKIESEIKSIEYVNPNNIKFINKRDAFYRAKERLGSGGETVVEIQGYTEEEHPFLESYIITLTNLEKLKDVVEKLEGIDNVEGTSEGTSDVQNVNGNSSEIVTSDENISEKIDEKNNENKKSKAEVLTGFNKNVNIVLLAVGGILVAFSVIIIGNTIKLTVHARRREISIMKYVGATNNFIRAPFIVEGIIIGIISSFISIILLGGLYVWLKQSIIEKGLQAWLQTLGKSTGISELLHFDKMMGELMLIFLIIGIGIGVLGSIRSMRKYLKV